MKLFASTCIIIFLSFLATAQKDVPLPQILPEDIPQVELTANEVYDRNSVWSYHGDQTELYMEYAFLNLRVQEFVRDQEKYKIEVYRMKNDASAFGIYSINRQKCTETNLFTNPDCMSRFGYLAAKGPVYVSVINSSGSPAATEQTRQLAQILIKKVIGHPHNPNAFRMLPDSLRSANSVMLVKGSEGIKNTIPRWSTLFEDMVGYDLFLLTLERAPGEIKLAEVDFPSESQQETFILQNIPGADLEKEKLSFAHQGANFGILQIDERHLRMYETKVDPSMFKSILEDFGF